MNAIPNRPAQASETAATPAKPRSRRRLLGIPLAILALVLAVVAGNWWLTEGRWIESTDNAYVQGDITVVSPRIDGGPAKDRASTYSPTPCLAASATTSSGGRLAGSSSTTCRPAVSPSRR